MSSLAQALVTWEQFLQLPDLRNAAHYELHDGQAVVVPPPKPVHVRVQQRIQQLLQRVAEDSGPVMTEFPYRPHPQLQFWKGDVAFIPAPDWERTMSGDDYVPYAPALIVEVLSPSNRESKVNRQRIVAFSAGTLEFWVVDIETRTVQVTTRSGVQNHGAGEVITLTALAGKRVGVADIFE